MSQHAAEEIALLWNASLIADEVPPCLSLKLIFSTKKLRLILYFKKERKKERRSSEGWQSWSHNVTGFSYSLREQQPTNFQFARKETELEFHEGMKSCVIPPLLWAMGSYNNTKKLYRTHHFFLLSSLILFHTRRCKLSLWQPWCIKKKRAVIKTLIQPSGK